MKSIARMGIIAIFVALCALAISGCGGASDSSDSGLIKDTSESAEWGTTLQFKVKSGWEKAGSSESTAYYLQTMYTDNSGNPMLNISLENPNSSTYGQNLTNSYDDWKEYVSQYYSRTSQQMADVLNEAMGVSAGSSAAYNADMFPSYLNYSCTELDDATSHDKTYKLYKVSYDYEWTDAGYEDIKSKNSQIQKSGHSDEYYALLKDGTYDVEIITEQSEALLRDFVGTLNISN